MEYRISEGILTVEPGEEIDQHQAAQIIRYAETLIRQRRIRMIIFDMADTIFMDSAGVGMLIGLYRELKTDGGGVAIIRMPESIRRIYQMAGLAKIIPHYRDEKELLASVRDGTDNGAIENAANVKGVSDGSKERRQRL